MSDIIQLLPDAVANQIAAGEVIQRPASVVKELTENAIDAGATEVKIIIKDAGRTLIQIIDNGSGMSETDARMAFERHATSKIKEANDLFSIRTMGFRGEALASIAAVAHVELNTKTADQELGTRIVIAGSKVETQEPVSCPTGSNFLIKNLFYNVPARRRFLKTNATELRHIITEVQRVALANEQVAFTLIHNDQPLINLQQSNLRQRIIGIIGKQCNAHLLPVNTESSIVNVRGFIGKPQTARRTAGDQYFFVNNRYMRHPYLYKAVMDAYENLIAKDAYPSWFLFFDINPDLIDVNIHPTKTEIKFEDEKLIWKILNAAVRESLGKHNAVPSIDFDTEGQINIPAFTRQSEVKMPEVKFNPDYNPFKTDYSTSINRSKTSGWESLYRDSDDEPDFENLTSFEDEDETPESIVLPSRKNPDYTDEVPTPDQMENPPSSATYFQMKGRFIITPVKSGLMIIDQRRAHERILYEQFLHSIKTNKSTTQQVLFAETLVFNEEECTLLREIKAELSIFGFDLEEINNGEFRINGIPSEFDHVNASRVIENLLEAYKTGEVDPAKEIREQLATIMARNACMKNGETLSAEEMTSLTGKLFRCNMPHFSPTGKPVITIIDNEELDKRFR
ncbi:DNA mismatch repair endonuclease MutL [Alkalitalea saponilacus]|uniref:DNA mismatch repair protein MutL n=1 Tax=Alkalitalea saponilacus TaxID=889453 RepID=A0A1T5A2M1_9BACT|nr:DNA mismatch repair endonuclease MutL [Alkalitalea saponilacus]ASB48897.1 DNA mismatch repair protein MutL [Alkalitalea saponilacus]SKB29049.1 DNA mismatch repair protein MutL [Alkalitalea saponilacus]